MPVNIDTRCCGREMQVLGMVDASSVAAVGEASEVGGGGA